MIQLQASALTPSVRTAIFDALEKDELIQLCEELSSPPASFSDQHIMSQHLANQHWKMLRLKLTITIE